MRNSLSLLAVVGISASLSLPAAAEQLELTISGVISDTNEHADTYAAAAHSMQATIIYDTSVEPEFRRATYLPIHFIEYPNTILSISYAFFDVHGDTIEIDGTTDFDATSSYLVDENLYHLQYPETDAHHQRAYFKSNFVPTSTSDFTERMRISFWHQDDADIIDMSVTPHRINTGDADSYVVLSTTFSSDEQHQLLFTIHSPTLTYSLSDDDNDGVANGADLCTATAPDTTVVIDGIDSGVTNHIDADGCAISDHFAACEAEQQSSPWLAYRGPTMCETRVMYDAYRNGLIDYMELRQLRATVY